ncbi:MAG: GGDEF domain-containing protein [Pygmaiobacter massiliensis]|nr:GGDEF domain-containing protein [Pygmaiobacter massiliensis]
MLRVDTLMFFVLTIASVLLPSYRYLFFVFLGAFLSLCLVLLMQKELTRRWSALACFYSFFALSTIYSIIVSICSGPTFVSVNMLALLLLHNLLMLDKTWRIALFSFVSSAAYLGAIAFFKTPTLAVDEFINVFSFFLLSVLLGTYHSTSQLESFDLKRRAEIGEITDPLTHLYNRKKLYDVLQESCHADCSTPVCGIAMIDVDKFKQYNDCLGHQAGDRCLETLGLQFAAFGSAHDLLLFRYGGEEFVAVSKTHTDEQLVALCCELGQKIVALGLRHPAAQRPIVTISIGVSYSATALQVNCDQMISQADLALYAAKRQGRNAVCCFGPPLSIHSLDAKPPDLGPIVEAVFE